MKRSCKNQPKAVPRLERDLLARRACSHCGQLYYPSDRGAAPCWCRDCNARQARDANRRRKGLNETTGLPPERACVECGRPFQPSQRDNIVCGQKCWRLRRQPTLPCAACGGPKPRQSGRKYCERCSIEQRQAHDRRKNTLRRNAAAAGIEADNFTTDEIGERDGWRCHLCKEPVDPAQSRMSSGGATIDHLIPVSAGGTDTRVNVALAHKGCNSARRERGAAQLLLFG